MLKSAKESKLHFLALLEDVSDSGVVSMFIAQIRNLREVKSQPFSLQYQ